MENTFGIPIDRMNKKTKPWRVKGIQSIVNVVIRNRKFTSIFELFNFVNEQTVLRTLIGRTPTCTKCCLSGFEIAVGGPMVDTSIVSGFGLWCLIIALGLCVL